MPGIYEDVRRALRLMAANPAVSLAVLLSLALGIGVSTKLIHRTCHHSTEWLAEQREPVLAAQEKGYALRDLEPRTSR